DLVRVLVLASFLLLLRLLVTVLAEIDEPANGRVCVGRNLDQVNPLNPRHGQGFTQRDNPELLLFLANYTHFAGTDFPVDPNERTGGRRVITRRERAAQDTL